MVEDSLDGILAKFGINNVEKFDLVHGGFNKNWIVSAQKKKYILKRRSINEKQNSEKECKIASLLIENGISTAMPISNKNENFCVEHGPFVYSLFEYIDGKKFNGSKRNIEMIAEAMARIHLIKNEMNINFEGDCISWGKYWILSYASKYISEIINCYNNAERTIRRSKFPKAIIHWDIHPGNVIYSGDNVYVFDLEFIHRDYRIVDISNSLTLLAGINLKKVNYGDAMTFIQKCKIDLKKASWFVKAYNKINKLSEIEIQNLPSFLQITWLGWSFYTLYKKKIVDTDLSDIIYLPKWVEENKNNIINKLKVVVR